MWIRLLLLIQAVVAPAAATHVTADVVVQHASSVVPSAKAKAAPDNIVLEPASRSIAPALRSRDAASHTSRRLQEDTVPEKKGDIFHAENDAAAKTRAHLAKIAEMESKKRIREGRDDASDVETDEKEASIRSNNDDAYKAAKTKDLFHRTESKMKTTPTLTETTMPDTIKTVRWQDQSEPDSSQGGIRSMTPGAKLGMSVAFVSLLALIFINVYQTRSRREYLGLRGQNDDGMNKWEDIPMSYVFCANAGSDAVSDTHDDDIEKMDKMHKEIDDIAKSHLLDDIIDETLNLTQDTLDLTQDTDAGAEEEEGKGFQGFEIV